MCVRVDNSQLTHCVGAGQARFHCVTQARSPGVVRDVHCLETAIPGRGFAVCRGRAERRITDSDLSR